jgi:hypothetical protein
MKPGRPDDPARWRERDVDAHALEARAAVLAEAARPVQPLGARAVARIRAELGDRTAVRQRFFDFRRLSLPARAAVGLALILIGAATADGAGVLLRKHFGGERAPQRSAPPPAVERTPRAPRPLRRAVALDVDQPQDPAADTGAAAVPSSRPSDDVTVRQPARHGAPRERAEVAPPVLAPVPVLAPAPVLAPVPVVAPAPSQPAPFRPVVPAIPEIKTTEAGMVAAALSQLRQQGDPRAALATLDAYALAFPHGVLETEALRTRAEAVIRLDDRKTALALLDAMPGLSESPGTDLLLTRAELRAAGGRFREALGDFTRVVDGQGGAAAASERALYGRAVCFGRLAEDDRARADLLAYERRFPSGLFAIEVRRLLSESEHP